MTGTPFANGTDAWGHVDEIGNLFCKPDEVKSGQLRKIHIKYAKAHPDDLYGKYTSVALEAFKEAFPCQ